MRTRVLTCLLAAAVPIAGPATAGAGWYVSLEAGTSNTSFDRAEFVSFKVPAVFIPGPWSFGFSPIRFDEGTPFFATLGAEVAEDFRLEVEGASRNADYAGFELNQKTIMFNALYDIPLFDKFELSVGGGIGVDLVELNAPKPDDGTEFAYQLIAGISYEVSEGIDVAVNYRYLDASDTKVGPDAPADLTDAFVEGLTDSSITLGIRIGL